VVGRAEEEDDETAAREWLVAEARVAFIPESALGPGLTLGLELEPNTSPTSTNTPPRLGMDDEDDAPEAAGAALVAGPSLRLRSLSRASSLA